MRSQWLAYEILDALTEHKVQQQDLFGLPQPVLKMSPVDHALESREERYTSTGRVSETMMYLAYRSPSPVESRGAVAPRSSGGGQVSRIENHITVPPVSLKPSQKTTYSTDSGDSQGQRSHHGDVENVERDSNHCSAVIYPILVT